MNRFALLLAVAGLLALPVGSYAAPSLVGPTGLLIIPSAETVGALEWNVGVSALELGEDVDASVLYANAGLTPELEVGVAQEKFEGQDAELLFNAKLRLLKPLPGKISLAVGLIDVTDEIDRTLYVVGSHALGAGLLMREGQVTSPQLHVGIGGGRLDGLFLGLSATYQRRVSLMVEYDSEDLNLGGRWPLAANLDATLAALDGLDGFGLGLSYSSPW